MTTAQILDACLSESHQRSTMSVMPPMYFRNRAVRISQDPCADYGLPAGHYCVSAPSGLWNSVAGDVYGVVEGGRVATLDEALAAAERIAGPLD